MPAVKLGVREFREQIARYLESDAPVAVTRRGETLGVYIPTPRKRVKSAELKAAGDLLAAALAGVREEDVAAVELVLSAAAFIADRDGTQPCDFVRGYPQESWVLMRVPIQRARLSNLE